MQLLKTFYWDSDMEGKLIKGKEVYKKKKKKKKKNKFEKTRDDLKVNFFLKYLEFF